jgi:hypothetical protein
VNTTAASRSPVGAQVHDLIQRRLERALRERVRYRYVKPNVLVEEGSYRIQSPCCSRTVDPAGGVIDIALLVPHEANSWCLCSRDHATSTWVARFQDESLDNLLDLLCMDSERQFWP